jgi:beta-glucosidase-like glycosyl hydrolase
MSAQDLLDTTHPPFRACVRARALGLMCSYNAINGTPACADSALLSMARDQWGFDGVVVTDCDAMGDVYTSHHYAPNASEAVRLTLAAGTDIDCGHFLSAHVEQVSSPP